jgi:glycosyltransferase A (GT-A) superfamily protein (DUF2064 family)
MTGQAPAVIVMARAPRRGTVHRALEPVLGIDGALAVHTALLMRTIAWAQETAGDLVFIAYEPADAHNEVAAVVGAGGRLFPQSGEGIASRTAAASAHVFTGGERPLLIVWPSIPRLGAAHAGGALDDLAAGCDIVLGPVFDGGLYMVGLARPVPALFSLSERTWRSPDLISAVIAAAHERDLAVGLLRAERALHRPADVRAALADPLVSPELVRVLRRAR